MADTNAQKLRSIFDKEPIVVIPGAYDALSTLIAQNLGFGAAYLGGYSISASKIAAPDWGFATMTEMQDVAVNARNVLDIPLLCDIDEGFGSLTNFVRAIQSYEDAGVAAVHFEDQPFPKKCSQQTNREVIPLEEAVKKVKAAVETRRDPNFMLLARTDSKGVEGIDGVKRRISAYLEAGADYAIFCEQSSVEELAAVAAEFPGRVVAFVEDTPDNPGSCLPVSTYEEMGYKGLVFCALGLRAAYQNVERSFGQLFETGHLSEEYVALNMAPLSTVNNATKTPRWQAVRDKYAML